LRVYQIKNVLLIPQGGLSIWPLHAASFDVKGEPPRYFLDEFGVTYIPSLFVLNVCQSRAAALPARLSTLFAVADPTMDLDHASAEVEGVTSAFDPGNYVAVSGSDASCETVRTADATYLHFACHGVYDWTDVRKSGLVLAGNRRFTLGQVRTQLRIASTRLVVLSACETGITEFVVSPDEYIGLATGFVQAGAPAVISTLWAVNDLSTMLLMQRFYNLHVKCQMRIADALRESQIWLRDVTSSELAQHFIEAEKTALEFAPDHVIERVTEHVIRFSRQDPNHRPFSHPYYWAPFIFTGAT
jgi:CHAT domain-containing protein